MKRRKTPIVIIVMCVISAALALFFFVCFLFNRTLFRLDLQTDTEIVGQYGDFVGGVIGTIVSTVLLYFTFKQQREDSEANALVYKKEQMNDTFYQLIDQYHKKALILGTGGASKAIDYGLKSLGMETVAVSRYQRPGTIQYEDVTAEIIKEYNVIVNCTPCGMYPNTEECPKLPYEAMDSHTILYDLIYNPDTTLFMKKGAEQGATTKNGLEMLLLQAFASWDFWTGKGE